MAPRRTTVAMTNLAEHSIAALRPPVPAPAPPVLPALPACDDERWPALAQALSALRAMRRRSVRIVDVGCGSGALLVCAACHARALGFTAIEGHGIDPAPGAIARAQEAAEALDDPAIGLVFEAGDPIAALADEAAFPADILVVHGAGLCSAAAARAAARMLIAESGVAA